MIVKYVNTYNEEVILNDHINIKLREADFFRYAWETSEISGEYKFSKETREYKAIIEVLGTISEKKKKLNRFFEIVERDVLDNKQGRLYYGEQYMLCNVIESNSQPAEGAVGVDKEIVIFTNKPYWITESKFSVFKEGKNDLSGLDLNYPHQYPHNYTADSRGFVYLYNDHYTSCDFEMIIYGPCINPHITIGDHLYEVKTVISDGEYLKIRSKERKVERYRVSGTIVNEFNNRNKTQSIFEKIDPGNNLVTWDGGYGFDIVLLKERGEPRWI